MATRFILPLAAAALLGLASLPAHAYSCGTYRPLLFEVPASNPPSLDDVLAGLYTRDLVTIGKPSAFSAVSLGSTGAEPEGDCSRKIVAGLWIPDTEFAGAFSPMTAVLIHSRWNNSALFHGVLDVLVSGNQPEPATIFPVIQEWGAPYTCTLDLDGVRHYFYKLCIGE